MSKTLTTSWQLIKSTTPYTGFTIAVYAKYSSQSVSGNSSNVDVEERIICASGTAVHCYTHNCNFTGNKFDKSDSKGSYYHGWESNTTTTILSDSKTLSHDANGDLSFTLGAKFSCSAGVSGDTGTETCVLPHINRRSDFSLSKTTFDIGETIQATITQYVNAYHQNLYIVIGGNDVLIQSSATGTIDIETNLLANTIYQQIPNANYYESNFKLVTLDSSNNVIGTKTIGFRANVVDSNPTFNVAYQDTNATTTAVTQDNQQIIQNKSTLQINITGASVTHYAGSLTSASVTINNQVTTILLSGTTNVSADINIGTLNLSQNTNAIVRVTDSRGNYLEKTITILVLPYESPSAIVTLKRKLNYYTQTDINVDANYSSLDGNNTINITYRIKKTTDTTWGNYATLQDNVPSQFNADNNYAWDVQVLIQDALETKVISDVVGTGNPALYVDVLKNSVGINCFPTQPESLEISGKTIFDLIYPIGSIYISVNSTNPGTLFGGTWVEFAKGRTLVGVDANDIDFSTAEATGGSKEMQEHTHTMNSGGTHSHNAHFREQYYGGSSGNAYDFARDANASYQYDKLLINNTGSHTHTINNAGTGNSGNLQPYINVYMFKRIS